MSLQRQDFFFGRLINFKRENRVIVKTWHDCVGPTGYRSWGEPRRCHDLSVQREAVGGTLPPRSVSVSAHRTAVSVLHRTHQANRWAPVSHLSFVLYSVFIWYDTHVICNPQATLLSDPALLWINEWINATCQEKRELANILHMSSKAVCEKNCIICGRFPATSCCTTCSQRLCSECDRLYHSHPARATHTRVPVAPPRTSKTFRWDSHSGAVQCFFALFR